MTRPRYPLIRCSGLVRLECLATSQLFRFREHRSCGPPLPQPTPKSVFLLLLNLRHDRFGSIPGCLASLAVGYHVRGMSEALESLVTEDTTASRAPNQSAELDSQGLQAALGVLGNAGLGRQRLGLERPRRHSLKEKSLAITSNAPD